MPDNYRDDVKEVLDKLLIDMPGVSVGKAFGYPAYKVNRKVFCFVGGAGIAVKLPVERVSELIEAEDTMSAFEPRTGSVWKEWVSIDRTDAEDYRADVALFEEAIGFVAAKS